MTDKRQALTDKRQACTLLFDLASLTKASIEAAKIVRSVTVKATALEMYALRRMAQAMEQRIVSRVIQLLKSALRNPEANQSLNIALLSHQSFAAHVTNFLSSVFQCHSAVPANLGVVSHSS